MIQGMTLRDYFAAKAMQAELTALTTPLGIQNQNIAGVAEFAYKMADEMIKAKGISENFGLQVLVEVNKMDERVQQLRDDDFQFGET